MDECLHCRVNRVLGIPLRYTWSREASTEHIDGDEMATGECCGGGALCTITSFLPCERDPAGFLGLGDSMSNDTPLGHPPPPQNAPDTSSAFLIR